MCFQGTALCTNQTCYSLTTSLNDLIFCYKLVVFIVCIDDFAGYMRFNLAVLLLF